MNLDQAAALTGITRRTLYHWMQRGWLPYTGPSWRRQVILADVHRQVALKHLPRAKRSLRSC